MRGGLIATNDDKYYNDILSWLPVYEGFATYGGMSTKEVEAMAVGLREMSDPMVAGSGAEFVRYFVERLVEEGVPVVTPAGGLACHVDATRFVPHIPQTQYPAGALAAAIYLASGVRSMERGTISTDRDRDGNEMHGRPGAGPAGRPAPHLHHVAHRVCGRSHRLALSPPRADRRA